MSVVDWIIAGLTIPATALAIAPVVLAGRFAQYVRERRASDLPGDFTPKVSVILPCKGIDPGFDENIEAVLSQDYPDVEFVFATATADDEACDALRAVFARFPQVNARLAPPAGEPRGCSAQNNNQLKGIETARADTEVFIIMDSDARPHPQYIRHLVQPLADQEVAASTGYRWYMPITGGFGSWLRSVWNMGALPILVDPRRNFAWGGSMAFRKSDFPLETLRRLWGNALSDDHTLTAHVRELGKLIVYVPQCLAISHEDSTLASTIEWTTRQTKVTKVYDKPFWWTVFLVHATSTLFTLLALVGLAMLLMRGVEAGLLTWIWPVFLLPVIGQAMGLGVMWKPVLSLLPPDVRERLRGKGWLYALLAQPASLLALQNSVASILSNRVTWRGTTYAMWPTRTVVVGPR